MKKQILGLFAVGVFAVPAAETSSRLMTEWGVAIPSKVARNAVWAYIQLKNPKGAAVLLAGDEEAVRGLNDFPGPTH